MFLVHKLKDGRTTFKRNYDQYDNHYTCFSQHTWFQYFNTVNFQIKHEEQVKKP